MQHKSYQNRKEPYEAFFPNTKAVAILSVGKLLPA